MEKNIHFFDSGKAVKKEDILETIGTRGREAMELASLSLPLVPGFIFDSTITTKLKTNKTFGFNQEKPGQD
jgi:hypothetical protein